MLLVKLGGVMETEPSTHSSWYVYFSSLVVSLEPHAHGHQAHYICLSTKVQSNPCQRTTCQPMAPTPQCACPTALARDIPQTLGWNAEALKRNLGEHLPDLGIGKFLRTYKSSNIQENMCELGFSKIQNCAHEKSSWRKRTDKPQWNPVVCASWGAGLPGKGWKDRRVCGDGDGLYLGRFGVIFVKTHW
jgi:hypothetical protein